MSVRGATATDMSGIVALLEAAHLPTSDLADASAVEFWVCDGAQGVAGVVGLERHGEIGLLRSLVVDADARGRGLGTTLVAAVEAAARARGIRRMLLLTQTAREFFLKLGYAVIARDEAPEAVRSSEEFRSLCPTSAACMTKLLATEVLFLCTGNSCRSILGEAVFNHLAPAGWHAMSAGSKPIGKVHARSLALLRREGIATQGCCSKSWDDLPRAPDIVITVCSSAAGETCPASLGPAVRTHWGVDDPARATGTDEEIDAAFMRAYRTLRRRIETFLALPLAQLQDDRPGMKAELDRIGETVH